MELQGKLPCPQKPSRNSCHESNASNPKLPFHFINIDFCIFFKPVWGSIFSTMTNIYAGRSGIQISAETKEPSLLQNIQTSSSAHPASNSTFFSGSKVARADMSDHSHPYRAKFKIQWSFTSIQPVSLHGTAHIGKTLFYLYLLPMYISLNRSHPFWPYKGTLSIHYLPLICTLHNTFISSSLMQLH
jgi:hypothetical protein